MFQSESTCYSCLNVKELLGQSRCEIWSLSGCNCTRIHNHLVHKWTPNQLVKLGKWSSWVVSTYLYSAFDCPCKELLDIHLTIVCGFTLKCLLDKNIQSLTFEFGPMSTPVYLIDLSLWQDKNRCSFSPDEDPIISIPFLGMHISWVIIAVSWWWQKLCGWIWWKKGPKRIWKILLLTFKFVTISFFIWKPNPLGLGNYSVHNFLELVLDTFAVCLLVPRMNLSHSQQSYLCLKIKIAYERRLI